MKDYCGLIGIFGSQDAARLAYLGLYSLQHRGEESAGIVTHDGAEARAFKGMGTVGEAFSEETLTALKGHLAIGHVRYSTTGSSLLRNAQPFMIDFKDHTIALAHNGNLTNAKALRDELERAGSIFQTTTDSEIIVHLLVKSPGKTWDEKLVASLNKLEGAYSLILMIDDTLYVIRDPQGFKPLCLGERNGITVAASETCALDITGTTYVRDVEPGEVVIINSDGMRSLRFSKTAKRSYCIFEYIYFARPDSNIFGKSVYLTRKKLGATLAREHPVDADFVMPIPDSGNYAALGYAEKTGLPFEMGLVRNHYIGRTFIQPSQLVRDFKVRVKLNPVRDLLNGKRIIVVEDSIVRGTTVKGRVKALRDAGAKEIHMRVSCPPLVSPCYYGIDFPTKEELIAAKFPVREIRDFIGVDSLEYISTEGMLSSMLLPPEHFCIACFSGAYPTPIHNTACKEWLE